MELFGDESGHLRSILSGECDLFVVAVVGGTPTRCRACPKRAVRSVQDISEAHWCDLTDTQKRRVVDCLTESRSGLSFGYVAIEPEDIHQLQNHYRLYEDDLEHAWDLCVIGDCYAELILQLLDEWESPEDVPLHDRDALQEADGIGPDRAGQVVGAAVANRLIERPVRAKSDV